MLIKRNGDVQPNLVLLHHLETQGINVDPEEMNALVEGNDDGEAFDVAPAFALLQSRCTGLPEFFVQRQFIIGNFSFQKMAMVQDLRTYVEGLAGHDLIAAIAQDSAARDAVPGDRAEADPGWPDRRKPDEEFLVLDADSTQQRAVGCALAGQSSVISGPPGTGKSQPARCRCIAHKDASTNIRTQELRGVVATEQAPIASRASRG